MFDSTLQEKAYITFAYNNTYRQLIDESLKDKLLEAYESECLPAVQKCQQTQTNEDCQNAGSVCGESVENPIMQAGGDFDVYDVREPSNDPNPPETYSKYIARPDIMKAIGARSDYQECADAPGQKFGATGDGQYLDIRFQLTDLT